MNVFQTILLIAISFYSPKLVPVEGVLNRTDVCWKGTINGKIPVFIHYQVDNNVLVGEITYLNTKKKQPIRLLGTIDKTNRYWLYEFDSTGNVTGAMDGIPNLNEFNGAWSSPTTRKKFVMNLSKMDTIIESVSMKANPDEIFGAYHYQFGEKGYNGHMEFTRIGANKASFHILSLTNVERGPNIAEVDQDTITFKGDSFIYKIPESDNCTFGVKFYKDFAYISYTKGDCFGQFGVNATIEGVYLKIR